MGKIGNSQGEGQLHDEEMDAASLEKAPPLEKSSPLEKGVVDDGIRTTWAQMAREKLSKKKPEKKVPQKSVGGAKAGEGKEISLFAMFKYADFQDVICMTLGTIGAIGDGLASPAAMLLCSGIINIYGKAAELIAHDPAAFEREINVYVLRFVYLALIIGILSYLEAYCWMTTGERQTSRLRSLYLKAILRQEEAFFDTTGSNTAEVIDSISVDTIAIQEAISEKVGNFLANVSTFIGGFIISAYLVWRVALILLAFSPLLIIPGIFYGRVLANLAREKMATSVVASTVAEQALSSIRTVYSFVGESETMERYSRALDENVRLGLKMGLAKGFAVGSSGIIFALWAFMSWYGGILVTEKGVSGGKLICAGLASIAGGLALGTALANLKYFAEGRSAATRIFAMVDRVPAIDSENLSGRVLSSVTGTVELREVYFAYPARPDVPIFKSFNLQIPAGTTMALVGSSGSGKSTVVALIERFYDPLGGQVLIDGIDIRDLQLKWLRMQIGLVSQEPALFATSAMENILYGKDGATEEEAIRAAKAANAHGFISTLPNGYKTQVGEKGVQMSGGQKQRIAIARAILKNPRILLLDEATSALDAESESVVQAALESASIGRTTVVVAHRLSTIRRADSISVVSEGKIVETGTHDDLLRVDGGAYAALVRLQHSHKEKESHRPQKNSLESEIQALTFRSDSRSHFSNRMSRRGSKPSSEFGEVMPVELDDFPAYLDDPKMKTPQLSRLIRMNAPEWKQAIVGSSGAIAFGIIHPLYAFVLGNMVSVLYDTNHHKLRRKVNQFAIIYACIAAGSFLVNFMQHYNFSAMGELLTKRIQLTMLSKIFTFEVGWFDRPENSSGAVCSRLASEATVGRALVADRMSLLVQTASAIGFAFILGLFISWRLSVVMIAVQPIVIACYYARKQLLRNMYSLTMEDKEGGTQVASEAVVNHRTISAFTSQAKIMALFERIMHDSVKETQKRSIIAGFGLGVAQAAMYFTWALDFWWGGKLISEGNLSFAGLFKVFFILVSAGRMVADAGSMTTDLAKGSSSIVKVFNVIDRETQIAPDESKALKLDKVEGNVQLRDVDFAYPSRPDAKVFKNFNLKVRAGKTVALVGQSGSGKSTIIGLIERYYDPLRGTVLIDGYDLRTLNLRSVRQHIALVSQEPTLFAGTIRENILYGRKYATEAEIIEAAKAANAYNFISSMKDGFDTQTGERGVQLSGGQKQRIAIARAVITNPAILLLDEATSALDAQSEKVVQEALDRIMIGRTTIVVAHRLSTIRNCETIAVLQDGVVLEKGSHDELMAKGADGAFYSLVQMQSRTDNAA